MFKHGAKILKRGYNSVPSGLKTKKAKMIMGGAAGLGLMANGMSGRSGRAADKPRGRPTGPYMY